MYNARARHFGNLRVMIKQSVEHSTFGIACAGVNHQIFRFVNDENIIIFINDI